MSSIPSFRHFVFFYFFSSDRPHPSDAPPGDPGYEERVADRERESWGRDSGGRGDPRGGDPRGERERSSRRGSREDSRYERKRRRSRSRSPGRYR